MPMVVPIHGHCSPRFERLRQLFETLLASEADLGASLALTVDGRFEVDLWGGFVDAARTHSPMMPHARGSLRSMPETTLNWMRARANALLISGTQHAQQLASHSPVVMLS